MKINRTQDTQNVPDWVTAGTYLEAIEKNAKLLQAGVERLNVTAASEVDEMCLFRECDQIEKCASSNKTYYYNSTWNNKDISHLREFASICGLRIDKMIGIDPTSVIRESSKQIEKTASVAVKTSSMENALKEALGDPFHIEDRADMSHMEKSNWQVITPESKLSDIPVTAMNGGICPIRGGENYRISNQPSLASNQNSISDPGVLDRLWKSEEESNGERLARQAEERINMRSKNHENWQNEKVSQMKADGFEAQGVVFPTEVGNVGSGISSSFMGAYSEADLKNLPDRTAGESLSDQNEIRKASIQREAKVETEEWERIKASPSRMVSDYFTNELKKRLG